MKNESSVARLMYSLLRHLQEKLSFLNKLSNVKSIINSRHSHDHSSILKTNKYSQKSRISKIVHENIALASKLTKIMISVPPASSKQRAGSLNARRRKEELKRINSQNQIILMQISNAESMYSKKKANIPHRSNSALRSELPIPTPGVRKSLQTFEKRRRTYSNLK